MNLKDLDLYFEIFKTVLSFITRLTVQKGQAIVHRHTYRLISDPRNVIVVGGSFAGALLAQRLCHTVPSGYRVILIEKHSHFNHAFGFPRNAVFSGREHHAFISYDNLAKGAPDGIFQQVRDEVTDVTESHVNTAGGVSLPYEYLIIATGAAQPPPGRLIADTKEDGIKELKGYQQRIEKADRVAVIGGGAVGVELVTEIKERYPDKQVTLIHSREHLLPRFGPKLHERVLETLQKQEIEVLLGERPAYPSDAGQLVQETSLKVATGETRTWDLVIPCTGLRPRSELLSEYSPKSIAPNGEILVGPTLQVQHLPSDKKNIFGLGDVAQSGGPKQARAGLMQAEVVISNLLQLMKGGTAKDKYVPHFFENTLNLTLGKEHAVMWMQKGDYEWIKETKGPDEDLNARQTRWQLNAKIEEDTGNKGSH
ncbi:uncharacterized protein FIESC28_07263 [Fusarium coffeatum]|uniref:FAD/NAD(P)-binding domain-containing protein n=1 Tax=Fusarium coffeatum TaxID=231269 RepID=A0A366RFP9_9HYPO|nr:uncharacterized protein FIESC28_07263 [Fusarium coffeatum]RBR15622.1 hypothetical protein FIESC28_07263 [Fusarium coffeatum]